MLFENKIEKRARELFTFHKETGRIVSGEELNKLAHQEATEFYQNGKVFIFTNVHWLGDETDITGTYKKEFIDIYTSSREFYQSSH